MAASEVQICNNALIKLGADTITSLSDNTKSARLCNTMYSIVRDEVLRSHLWNFAIGRQQLSQLSTAPSFEFSYQYQLPTDCLRAVRLYNSVEPFRVEGRKLLTDSNSVSLIYIKKETDVGLYDSVFSDILATKLASEIAYSITKNSGLSQSLKQEYDIKLKHAKRFDAQEGTPLDLTTNTFTSAHDIGSVGSIYETYQWEV